MWKRPFQVVVSASKPALITMARLPLLAPNITPITIDRFADTAIILIYIVSNSYYGMLGGWGGEGIHINLSPEHPIMSFETIEIKMAAAAAKRSISNSLPFAFCQ